MKNTRTIAGRRVKENRADAVEILIEDYYTAARLREFKETEIRMYKQIIDAHNRMASGENYTEVVEKIEKLQIQLKDYKFQERELDLELMNDRNFEN